MKRFVLAAAFCLVCVASRTALAQAAKEPAPAPTSVPALVPFAGLAVDAGGKALGESAAVAFRIYQEEQGGEPLWSETQSVALDLSGHYKANLGAESPGGIPIELFGTGEARWLEVEIAGLAPQPRVLLASVPYALKAEDAQTLAGRAASVYVTREDLEAAMAATAQAAAEPHPEDSLTGSGTSGFLALWTGASNLSNSVMSESGTKIGVDNASPTATLDVIGTSALRGAVSVIPTTVATSAAGVNSPVLGITASSFQNGASAVNQNFGWQVQYVNNNTATPGGQVSLLHSTGAGSWANTGLYLESSGSIATGGYVAVTAPAATAAAGGSSQKLQMEAQAFNSSTSKSVVQTFGFGAVPAGNNTTSPSANMDLMFASGSTVPTPTGLSFAPNGVINFVPSQTFPGIGTITGVTTTSPITGGGTSGSVNIGIDPVALFPLLTSSLNTQYPQLAAPNTFTQSQTMNQALTVAETATANLVNSTTGYQLGGMAFETGDFVNRNVSLGFSSNPTAEEGSSTVDNIGVGVGTLAGITQGAENVAVGSFALNVNEDGEFNTAVGASALSSSPSSGGDTAVGAFALEFLGGTGQNTGGNTAVGTSAFRDLTSGLGNTAVGSAAGEAFAVGGNISTSGTKNTYIGTQARPGTLSPLTNATAIGATAAVNESFTMILGGTGANAVGVGIGTTSTLGGYALDVEATTGETIINGVTVNANGGNIFLGRTNGTDKVRMDTNGEIHAAGGFTSSGADFAESMAVRGKRSEYEPGDLLAIDPGGTRRLALARTPYSTLVAGIYSTKPGMLASPHDIDDARPTTTEVPLAVVGIVPCKVTAENGPIKVGDLLVTSSRPGYAMKGTDRRKMLGAVVGKALEPLAKGSGAIQVLVTLQ